MSNTLFIPIELKAMVVNDQARKGQNFQRWQMKYKNLESYASPMPPAFSSNTESGWNNDPSANGVYLHWSLPQALRTGEQNNQTAKTAYPLVPNRWLVVRYSGPLANRTATGWVVESDYLDPDRGTSPYIDPHSRDKLQITRIGRKIDIASWSESATEKLFLTAIGPGDITFSAYQPYAENVFSIHDPLTGVRLPDTVSYLVVGWYSNPADDILASVTDVDSFKQKLNELNWQVKNDDSQFCSVSLYHGMSYGIEWDQTGPIPTSARPTNADNVSLAIGNTSIDALTALIQKQADDAHKSDEIDTQLLEAFQYNLLPLLDRPNGPDLLRQAIHKAGFCSYHGGYEWVIVKTPQDQSGATAQVPYPEAPIEWTDPNLDPDWLSALNQNQTDYDRAFRSLQAMQGKLYRLWWTKGKFDNIGFTNQQILKKKDCDFTCPHFDNLLNSVAQQTQRQAATVADLLNAIPHGATQQELKQSIREYAQKNKLPEGYELKRYARQAFYQANDPVVLISGAKASSLLHVPDALTCRFDSQSIAGLTYGSHTIDVASMDGKIPTVDLSKFPAEIASLIPSVVNEFFFLDPNNATAIATIALNDSSPSTVKALTAQMSDHKNEIGQLPDLVLSSWQQPWKPLFLLWTVFYYPIQHDDGGKDNWEFDGYNYKLIDPNLPQNNPEKIVLSGTTLLTPQSSFNFQKQLDKYRKNHPELDATELKALEDFIDVTDDWDFLSQTLDGFMFQLTSKDNESNRTPVLASTIGRLIGSNNSIVPDLGALPQPFKGWQKSNFQQYRSGQFCFEKLMVVDIFGQSIEVSTSQTYLEIKPTRAPDMIPAANKTVLSEEPYRFIQLSPRLLQPARFNFDFVSANDDKKIIHLHDSVNPVCAWVLPNHIDRALACYDPAGHYLGELRVVTNENGQRVVKWEFAPNSGQTTQQQLATDFPHLGEMVKGLIEKGAIAFDNFFQVIDETLWVVEPLGSRNDRNLSVLVGRPLALTRAKLQYELDGPPVSDPSWQYVFKPSIPDFIRYTYPVRLGELKLRNDGLIGYFTGSDYGQFNSVHMPPSGTYTPTDPPYVVEIKKGNFIDLSFEDGSDAFITMLVDPRASVHATTSILPTSILEVPAKFVEPALSAMEVVFHAGPILSETFEEKSNDSSEHGDVDYVLLPKPAAHQGQWLWLSREGIEWNTHPIRETQEKAKFSNRQSILRTGRLKLTGALNQPK